MNVGIAYRSFFGSFQKFFDGLKLINPEDSDSIKKFDLVIFSGGEDINPNLYGRENTYSSYSDERDRVESHIFSHIQNMRGNKPYVLGVCRGHQLINALLGGTLCQDLGMERKVSHGGFHGLDIHKKTSLTSFLKNVNSMHHQGVERVGQGLVCTASWKGIPEVCESNRILTVQFHPEFMGDQQFFSFVRDVVEKKKTFLETTEKTETLECFRCGFSGDSDMFFVLIPEDKIICASCRARFKKYEPYYLWKMKRTSVPNKEEVKPEVKSPERIDNEWVLNVFSSNTTSKVYSIKDNTFVPVDYPIPTPNPVPVPTQKLSAEEKARRLKEFKDSLRIKPEEEIDEEN